MGTVWFHTFLKKKKPQGANQCLTLHDLSGRLSLMSYFSTQQAAKKLGIGVTTLDRYIEAKKVPAPKPKRIGNLERPGVD
jgi:excisionase family DNA binding protein